MEVVLASCVIGKVVKLEESCVDVVQSDFGVTAEDGTDSSEGVVDDFLGFFNFALMRRCNSVMMVSLECPKVLR